MGTLQFLLPPDLTAPALDELKRGMIAGGQDNMPFLTQAVVEPGRLRVTRRDNESGSVQVPWLVDRAGLLMNSTATLLERPWAYTLLLELARGKVNQLRNQTDKWLREGLTPPPALPGAVREATMTFARAVARSPSVESSKLAPTALTQAHAAAEQLLNAYTQQVFQLRHQRQPRLDTNLGCRLETTIPSESLAAALRPAFNTVCLPLSWATIEPVQGDYRWQPHDQLLDWAITAGFHVIAGPLIDFHPANLPSWLRQREQSLAGINMLASTYIANVIKRYHGRIRTWHLTAASNVSNMLALNEDETLWLTRRIAETGRQWDPNGELVIGVAQPWGDYLATQPRTHSPFLFADMLVRSGLNLAGLNLELVMGVSPPGSYCRDLLDTSRIIDLFADLGLPLHITLGFPSHTAKDDKASANLAVNAGRWRDNFTPALQAEWATTFGQLALCKPSVRCVLWTHLHDAEPHLFPACGLVDAAGNAEPALKRLEQLRSAHLR